MKKLLVHLHLFYKELYPELKQCVLNLERDYDYDFFVTMVENHQDLIDDLKTTFPKCKIIIVKNVGFDIAPFLTVLNQVNLDDYSYIVKLHTKRKVLNYVYYEQLRGDGWRNLLLSFIKDKDTFNKIINKLERKPSIGMHSDLGVMYYEAIDGPVEVKKMREFLTEHNYKNIPYRFVAGSMFIARSEIFKEFKEFNYKVEDFEAPDLSHNGCQLAHLLERFIGYSVSYHKMTIRDCRMSTIKFYYKLFRKLYDKDIYDYLMKIKWLFVDLLYRRIFTKYFFCASYQEKQTACKNFKNSCIFLQA